MEGGREGIEISQAQINLVIYMPRHKHQFKDCSHPFPAPTLFPTHTHPGGELGMDGGHQQPYWITLGVQANKELANVSGESFEGEELTGVCMHNRVCHTNEK